MNTAALVGSIKTDQHHSKPTILVSDDNESIARFGKAFKHSCHGMTPPLIRLGNDLAALQQFMQEKLYL